MPIYEFECGGCGETGEYLLPMDAEPDSCSYCTGSGPLIKRFSPFSALTNTKGPGQSLENHDLEFIPLLEPSEIPEDAKLVEERKAPGGTLKIFELKDSSRDSGPSLDSSLN